MGDKETNSPDETTRRRSLKSLYVMTRISTGTKAPGQSNQADLGVDGISLGVACGVVSPSMPDDLMVL